MFPPSAQGRNLESSGIEASVDEFFKETLSGYDNYKFEIVNLPENAVAVKFLTKQFEKKNLVSIPAQVIFENGNDEKVYLSIRLQLFKKALIAKTLIEREELLKREFFVEKEIDVTNAKGTPVFSFDEIKNTVSEKRFAEGEVLIKEYISAAPVIKTGDKVTASIITGSTVISVDAVSKQDGAEGDIIRIVTPDKKMFKAKVIDSRNVEIVE